jgi:hypothetical protein
MTRAVRRASHSGASLCWRVLTHNAPSSDIPERQSHKAGATLAVSLTAPVPRRGALHMADLNVIVLDTGSDTVKAGYCYPDRDPLLVRHLTDCHCLRLACHVLAGVPGRPSTDTRPCGGSSLPMRMLTPPLPPCQVTPTAVRRAAEGEGGQVLRPVVRGGVTDWDAVESIYDHVFYDQVRSAGWETHARKTEEGGVLKQGLKRSRPWYCLLPHRVAYVRLTVAPPLLTQLKWTRGEEGGVLLVEPLFTPKARRQTCQARLWSLRPWHRPVSDTALAHACTFVCHRRTGSA